MNKEIIHVHFDFEFMISNHLNKIFSCNEFPFPNRPNFHLVFDLLFQVLYESFVRFQKIVIFNLPIHPCFVHLVYLSCHWTRFQTIQHMQLKKSFQFHPLLSHQLT